MIYKKVMIAVDSSKYSINAANYGIELAQQLKAQGIIYYAPRS